VKSLEVECLDLHTALEAVEEAENNAVEIVDMTEADGDITIRDGGRGSTDCGGMCAAYWQRGLRLGPVENNCF
jgi:hypothetical protein